MASIRIRSRADGTTTHVVNYRHAGRQSTVTFEMKADADRFVAAVNTLGAERALKAFGIGPTNAAAKQAAGPTVTEWINTYIDNLTGIAKSTTYDYRSYLRNDIGPAIGGIPVGLLTQSDIASWVQAMTAAGSSGKTISNKHGLLSAALSAAVDAGLIPANPSTGMRLPRSEKAEMCFLTEGEFQQMRSGFTARWWPLLDFLVASGARFGEVAALRPSDVNRNLNTVHIGRSMKRTYDTDRYEIGPTKTARSVRTISIDSGVLDTLDYSHPTLFVNTKGGPLRVASWRANVWYPSVARAELDKQPRIHDLRHTCASWMIAAGYPLPVVQAHLGHENINTTIALYYHLDRRQADAAAAALGAALRPKTENPNV